MDLFQLECFKRVVQCGTGVQAADQMHISQATLSRAISSLESELGVKLFERIGRKLILNEHGKLFYKYIYKALDIIAQGTEMVKAAPYESEGVVGIGCMGFNGILTECIRSYCAENPRTSFRFDRFDRNRGGTERLYSMDIIMTFSMWGKDNGSDEFPVTKELFDDVYYLVMSDKYMSFPENKKSLKPEEIKDLTYILMPTAFEPDNMSYLIWQEFRRLTGNDSPRIVEVIDFAQKLTLLSNGTGAGFLTAVCLPFAKKYDPRLRIYAIEGLELQRRMVISRRRRDKMSHQSADVWDYMLDYFNLPPDMED